MRRAWLTLIVSTVCLAAVPSAQAQGPMEKFGRGLVNVATCWIELPKRIAAGGYEDNPWTGIGGGFLRGASLMLLRFGVGAYETLTFPVGAPNHYASPYEGMEMPDYAWE